MPRGKPSLSALAGLGVIWAISGCFDLTYANCRITCASDDECPSSLICVKENGAGAGLCAPHGVMTCAADAGADAMDAGDAGDDAMDGGSDGSDATDGREAGTDGDAGGSGPPEVLCHNGNCFTLPPAVRANLVLLLWPSNLPAVGSPVSVWTDQSGQGNHAIALKPALLPHVIADGVKLDSRQGGTGFGVNYSPSLDFGSGDFAIIVVAGLSSSTARVSFFRQSDGARPISRQISIGWGLSASNAGLFQGTVNDTVVDATADVSQPSVGSYTLRRVTNYVEIRHNGGVLGSADLPTSGLSTSNGQNVFLGVSDLFGTPADSIEAVVALRGTLSSSSDLDELEGFLRTVFAATAP